MVLLCCLLWLVGGLLLFGVGEFLEVRVSGTSHGSLRRWSLATWWHWHTRRSEGEPRISRLSTRTSTHTTCMSIAVRNRFLFVSSFPFSSPCSPSELIKCTCSGRHGCVTREYNLLLLLSVISVMWPYSSSYPFVPVINPCFEENLCGDWDQAP